MSRRFAPAPLAALAVAGAAAAAVAASPGDIGPSLGIVNTGRHLAPYGRQATVGNFPAGGALTPDGRFYWTVSAGAGANDVRIVSLRTARVVQVLPLPGASGGIAIDPRGGRAYVSGLKDSTNRGTTRPDLPGGAGDVVHVFAYSRSSGRAREVGRLSVQPGARARPPQDFPLPQTKPLGYPEHPAISSDGRTLVVPLGLADQAAIVDTRTGRRRIVGVGRYPYAAAILPGDRRALVTNEAPGTVSVIDLRRGRRVADVAVGGHLAHPEGVAVRGRYAFVAIANRDQVAVLDTRRLRVVRTLSVGVPAGVGSSPSAVAVTADGRRLLVAEAGADAVSVFAIGGRFPLLGRVPTAHYPTDVAASGGRRPQLVWLSGKGLGTGPNPGGPSPYSSATLDQSGAKSQFLPRITFGSVGIGALPSAAALRALTRRADAQLPPANRPATAPPDTPIRPDGPIKHVFFVVRENRTYDQVLGDDPRGDGDPKLTLFGADITPNLHALAQRFPLLDHVFADSEASQQGHQWTAAGDVSDFAERNWNQISNGFAKYGDRGRPLEIGVLAVSFPPKGYLFDQALRQGISFFNYGEAQAGDFPLPYPQVPLLANTFDVDRSAADQAAAQQKFDRSDLGPRIAGGCFPNAFYLGTDILTGKQTYDSSVPPGAAQGAESRFDCFKQRFEQQLAAGAVPAFNYLTLPGDHTQGLSPGQLTPKAYVADNDYGTAQVVDLISHSPIWSQSAIFVVEDDSQDGADHVDAHRIPALVVSPYAQTGVVSTRYDQLSVLRTMELILGMQPLSLNDALATPMYDAFQAAPANAAPYDAIVPGQSRTERNPGPTARSIAIPEDSISQPALDAQLWRSVHGPRSKPPAPGPDASGQDDG